MRPLSTSHRGLFAPDGADSVEPCDSQAAIPAAPDEPRPPLLRAGGDSSVPGEAKPKRRKPLKTTTLTRAFYEARGWRVAFVERYVEQRVPGRGFAFRRRFDAWGFADHLMFKPGQPGMRAVNSCGMTGGAVAEHLTKILSNPLAYEFLACDPNNRIGIMAWGRPKRRGERYQMRFRNVTLADFPDGRPPEPPKADRRKRGASLSNVDEPCES